MSPTGFTGSVAPPQKTTKNILMFYPMWNTCPKSAGENCQHTLPSCSVTQPQCPVTTTTTAWNSDLSGFNDVQGAFQPGANGFSSWHSQPSSNLCVIDNGQHSFGIRPASEAPQAQVVIAKINSYNVNGCNELKLDGVAFFCHGWYDCMQFGFAASQLDGLANAIAAKSKPNVAVVLYACLTAAWDNQNSTDIHKWGFAYALREALVKAGATGCHVDGHTTSSKAVYNPDLKRFGPTVGSAGTPLYDNLKDPTWQGRFKEPKPNDRLKDHLCFAFPFMTADEIKSEVQSPGSYPDYMSRSLIS